MGEIAAHWQPSGLTPSDDHHHRFDGVHATYSRSSRFVLALISARATRMPSFRQKSDLQSDTKNLRQLDLLDGTKFDAVHLDVATVTRQSSLQSAIGLCISASGLDRKQIYGALELDAATFSRIESGQAGFPPNKLSRLMDMCANEAPLIWLAESRGYDFASMRKHINDHERRLGELEQENRDLKRLLKLKAEVGL